MDSIKDITNILKANNDACHPVVKKDDERSYLLEKTEYGTSGVIKEEPITEDEHEEENSPLHTSERWMRDEIVKKDGIIKKEEIVKKEEPERWGHRATKLTACGLCREPLLLLRRSTREQVLKEDDGPQMQVGDTSLSFDSNSFIFVLFPIHSRHPADRWLSRS